MCRRPQWNERVIGVIVKGEVKRKKEHLRLIFHYFISIELRFNVINVQNLSQWSRFEWWLCVCYLLFYSILFYSNLQCPYCDKKMKEKRFLKDHIKTVHDNEKTKFQCPWCDSHCTSRGNLNKHFSSYHTELFKNSPSMAKTVVGTKYVPQPTGKFPCDICGKLLKRPSNVLDHKQRYHPNTGMFFLRIFFWCFCNRFRNMS